MKRIHTSGNSWYLTAPLAFLAAIASVLVSLPPSQSAAGVQAPSTTASQAVPTQNHFPTEPPRDDSSTPSPKQKREILKSNFQKMKENAEDLAAEANALRDALEKSNANILSLDIVQRAEKIEKLAKKIKDGAKGY